MKSQECSTKAVEFYLKSRERPLKGFNQRSNMVRWAFQKDPLGCCIEEGEEGPTPVNDG